MPESVTDIHSFLGSAGYYHEFIPQFAKIAAPLTNMTRENTPFTWSLREGEDIPAAEGCVAACSSVVARGPREEIFRDYRCERFCHRSSPELGVG